MLRCYDSHGSSGISKRGEWMIGDSESYAGTVAEFWRAAVPAYRRDLHQDDPYEERERLLEVYGPVRSIIDVPFSFGTLTVISGVANAFSDRDVTFFQELSEAL
jgi:hypothetical protein